MNEKYQEPYCTPNQCDHGSSMRICSRCCPCEDCGKLRAFVVEEAGDDPQTTPIGLNANDIKWR